MSKFCTKCGRSLQENEVCNCQNEQKEVTQQMPNPEAAMTPTEDVQQEEKQQENPQYHPVDENSQQYNTAAIKEVAKGLLKQVFRMLLGFIKTPVTAGKKFILESDLKVAGIIVILQAILSGVFALVVCEKIDSSISSIKAAMGLIGSLASITDVLKMPYARIFIITVLASVTLSCFLAGMFWQGHKMIKCPVKYSQMLSAVAIRSSLLIPTIVASAIVFELKNSLGIFLFFALSVWGTTTMIIAMSSCVNDAVKDKFASMASIVLLIFFIVTIIVISRLWTFYLPDMVRTAMDGIQSMISNPQQIIEKIISEMYY